MYSYSEIKQIVEKEIMRLNFPASPAGLYGPAQYILHIGGKRFRPCLTLLSANIFTDTIENYLQPALAMEVFHNFTLMHDDIMDHAAVRRGQITVHKKWNLNTAILSGDVMLVKAYEMLCNIGGDKLQTILATFTKTAIEVCEGQQLDMDYALRNDVSIDAYIQMITLKTSVLLGCSAYIGAIIAGANEKDAKHIYDFGKNLGISFQIQDDLLDVFGDAEKFGKKTGGDIVQNKKTFLWVTLNQKLNAGDSVLFFEMQKHFEEEEKIKKVIALYKKYNVQKDAETAMQKYYDEAMLALQNINVPDEKKQMLQNLAEAIYKREF